MRQTCGLQKASRAPPREACSPALWVAIQECRQGALDTPAGRALIRHFSDIAPNLRRGVRIEPYGAHKGVGTKGGNIPGLFQEVAPKVYLYVGESERGVGTAAPRQSQKSVGTGRNDLCPCGPGKKYKRCCLTRAGRS